MDGAGADSAPGSTVEHDEQSFRRLIEPHRDRLWGVCLTVTGNRQDAEDALQECLIAVWRSLPRFRGDSSFSTWAYRIAVNSSIALIRRRKELAAEFGDLVDDRPSFDDQLTERDRVRWALEQLSEERKVALVLREYGELSYAEIAEHQDIPIQTVKSRINRARADVRRVLESGEV